MTTKPEPKLITATCGCTAEGRFVSDTACNVLNKETATGRERMRHMVAATKKAVVAT